MFTPIGGAVVPRPLSQSVDLSPRTAAVGEPVAVPERPLPSGGVRSLPLGGSWMVGLGPIFMHGAAVAAVLIGATLPISNGTAAKAQDPRPAATATAETSELTRLTPERKRTLETVRGMLAADKLGGADRTFNLADLDAVVEAMVKDKPGLGKAVAEKLRADGEHGDARIVEEAMNGGGGVIGVFARAQVAKRAPPEIKKEIRARLLEGGISADTARSVDGGVRQLSFAEMQAFSDATTRLRELQKRLGDELGSDLSFPKGLSIEAIDYLLSGGVGVPPGAVLTPRARDHRS